MRQLFDSDNECAARYVGFIDDAFKFVVEKQLILPELWARFVQQFREDADNDGAWRGEYWGKMMRGASLVYSYTRDPELYDVLENTVRDMISVADEDGRISTYSRACEFDAWDMWCRKYVLLGMQYFLEICGDDGLRSEIIDSMRAQLDYIIDKIGRKEDGKKEITTATRHWRGLNSSSVLEPVVRLYNLTGDVRYFDFAKYIVDGGFTDVENLIDLAYEDNLYPYQYPVTKAYEMTSCFEGLIEFYKITGDERYKTAIVNYADKVLESDFTVIGCCGCTHELFDHSTVRQANTNNGDTMQETCVTVTLMKFFYRVYLLTCDTSYVDAFEISLYNAYLGAFNTEQVIEPMIKAEHPDWVAEPLPFDSYSPLTSGTRGNGVGGLNVMSDGHYYGCCACIGAAGIGIAPAMQFLRSDDGLYLNLFINGTVSTTTPAGNNITLHIDTQYPRLGNVRITIETDAEEEFDICVRNPSWSERTAISVNDTQYDSADGYIRIVRLWRSGDVIELELDMRTRAIYPIPYGSQILMNKVVWGHNYVVPVYDAEDPEARRHIALQRGPVMLAQDNRLGYSVDDVADIKVDDDGYVDVTLTDKEIPFTAVVKADVPLRSGGYITLTDYASAGKLWTDESKMAVWMLVK